MRWESAEHRDLARRAVSQARAVRIRDSERLCLWCYRSFLSTSERFCSKKCHRKHEKEGSA